MNLFVNFSTDEVMYAYLKYSLYGHAESKYRNLPLPVLSLSHEM